MAKRNWIRRYRLVETTYTTAGERLSAGTLIYGEPWQAIGGWGIELTDSLDVDRPCTLLLSEPAVEPAGFTLGQTWRTYGEEC